jgi:hypothetical protein
MKKAISLMTAAVLSLMILAPPADAGNKQRSRWEGVAIGLGAAVLGSALLGHHNRPVASAPPAYTPPPEPAYRHSHRGHRHRGHWEIRKTWMAPVYERVWNPGHYNRKGRWVPGGYIRIEVESGYWQKQKVWVARR